MNCATANTGIHVPFPLNVHTVVGELGSVSFEEHPYSFLTQLY